MRTRQVRALAVCVLLTFMLSAMAAPRDGDSWWDRDFSFIRKVVKKLKKTFGVAANADTLTLPKP